MAFFYPPPPPRQGSVNSTPPLPHVPITPSTLVTISGVTAIGSVGTVAPVNTSVVPYTPPPATIWRAWSDVLEIELVATWTLAPDNPDQPPQVAPLSVTAQRIVRSWDVVWAAQRAPVSLAPMQVTLTGVEATGQLGTPTAQVTVTLTGVEATSVVGTMTGSGGLTVVVATGQVGSVGTPLVDVSLSGVQALGLVGSVSSAGNISLAITGVTTTGSVGTLGVLNLHALVGVTSTGNVGTLGALHTLALTSVTTTGSVGTVTASGGTQLVALTGVQATGEAGNVFVFGEFDPIWDTQSNQYLCPAGRIMVAS